MVICTRNAITLVYVGNCLNKRPCSDKVIALGAKYIMVVDLGLSFCPLG